MRAANKWTLDIERARATLISIKSNYHKKLDSNPLGRIASIPTIIFRSEPVVENYQDLAFIVPSEEESTSNQFIWSQIPRMHRMIGSYKNLLLIWDKRNEGYDEFKQS